MNEGTSAQTRCSILRARDTVENCH